MRIQGRVSRFWLESKGVLPSKATETFIAHAQRQGPLLQCNAYENLKLVQNKVPPGFEGTRVEKKSTFRCTFSSRFFCFVVDLAGSTTAACGWIRLKEPLRDNAGNGARLWLNQVGSINHFGKGTVAPNKSEAGIRGFDQSLL